MIRKLKIKFIVINMLIVSIMLLLIFGVIYYSTSRNLELDSIQMMERIAMNPMKQSPPNEPRDNVRLPYFSIIIDDEGNIKETGGDYFDLSDTDLLKELVDKTSNSAGDSGIISTYDLRYFKFKTDVGNNIVFSDISSEKSILLDLISNFTIIGGVTLLLFLGISICLAQWAVRPVDEAWKQQKQFVADASHELKTPLTVIMTNTELINSKECKKEDMEQYAGNILTMSKQMRGLVESLLELARIDNGNVKAAHAIVSLSEVISSSAMIFEPVFFENQLPFSYDVEPNIKTEGDESQLRQCVDILLDNASKYASEKGEVKLVLKKTSHKHCLLEVSDQGDKINDKDLEKLFTRFYRADRARKMNNSYGLGLSIAKSVVDSHKGRIWAESKDGCNSFFVELQTKE